jgi:hypothetical protein
MARERMNKIDFNGTIYPVTYDKWKSPIVYLPCDICGVPKKVHIVRNQEIRLTCLKCSNKSEDRARKISITKTGVSKTEEEKRKISKSVSNYRKENPFTEEDKLHKSISQQIAQPKYAKQKIIALLDYIAPGEYKYVGNGEVVIGNICPDFININGQKKVIEHFGYYWHRGENPQDIIDRYSEYGFKCLVIWENELNNPEKVIEKIQAFNERSI